MDNAAIAAHFHIGRVPTQNQVGKLTTCRLSQALQRRLTAARCGISAPDADLARTSRPTMPQDGVRAAGRPARS